MNSSKPRPVYSSGSPPMTMLLQKKRRTRVLPQNR